MPRSVALYSVHGPEIWLRQTPLGRGVWGECAFLPNSGADSADMLVVYDIAADVIKTRVPRDRRVLFLTEPPDLKIYSRGYLAQFGVVVAPFPVAAPNVRIIHSHSALPWYVGISFRGGAQSVNLSFDDLLALPPPNASMPRLSVVTSGKARLPQQKARLQLIEALKAELGDQMIVYGRGVRDIDDKYEAIGGSAFHLVLENNIEARFWTEKLADAYLGWAYPIYAGAPEAPNDFPVGAMAPVDISDPIHAAREIAARVRRGVSRADWEALKAARHKLMFEHNLFALIDRIAADLKPAALLARPETLHNYEEPSFRQRFRRLKNNLRRRFSKAR